MVEEEKIRKIKSFTDLHAWKNSHDLVVEIYKTTRSFPKEELFGLTNQVRRAAVSISSNIAEGFSRNSVKEKIQFYSMALGSLNEVQNQLLIAKDIGVLESEFFSSLGDRIIVVNKLINGLIKKCRSILSSA